MPPIQMSPTDASRRSFGGDFQWLRAPPDDESLIEDLLRGPTISIEPIAGDRDIEALIDRHASAKLMLSVSTGTAFYCTLSRMLAQALSRCIAPLEAAMEDVEIAVQEAIGNAVLHGNLRLPTLPSASPAALEARIVEIEARLSDPALALQRVTIECDWDDRTLSVAVFDQGDGFIEPPAPGQAPSVGGGRGLKMMRQLAASVVYDCQARCLRMTFPLTSSTLTTNLPNPA